MHQASEVPRLGLYRLLQRGLARPRAAQVIVLLSFGLMLFSLDTGLAADDYIHMMIAQGSREIAGFVRAPLDMFRFTGGDSTGALMREGVISWWDDPDVQLAFWRPVSSLTHLLDYQLWPSAAWAMHLHSALWGLLALAGVLALYRRLLSPPWVVALATAIYALDDGRAWFVSWVAARNAVVATAISVWALYYYRRARVDDCRYSRIAAPGLYALALLAGEGSISICAYLAAHAVFLDRAAVKSRLWSLAPFALVTLVWQVAYRQLGYGVRGSGLYFHPLGQPLAFAGALLERGPVLLFSQLGGAWSDAYTGLYPWPWLMHALWLVAAIGLLLFAYVLWPLWRSDPLFRFGTTGALLSAVPASAVFAADRMLSWIAIGGALSIARAIACYWQQPQLLTTGARRLLAPPAVLFLVISNLLIDPPFLASRARGNAAMRDIIDRGQLSVPRDPSIEQRFVIYMNPPAVPMATYIAIERAAQGIPRPARQYWLSAGIDPVTFERLDARSLRVAPQNGFVSDQQSQLLRDSAATFSVGQTIELDGLTIEVERLTRDGRPAVVVARFDRPLEDRRYLWLQWSRDRYVATAPPAVGQRVTLPEGDYLRMVFGDALDLVL